MFSRRLEVHKNVMNFTGEAFYTYACGGAPVIVVAQRPETAVPDPDNKDSWVFIVDAKKYNELKTQGRRTYDLAYLGRVFTGVNGLSMQSIYMYDDESRVFPTNGAT